MKIKDSIATIVIESFFCLNMQVRDIPCGTKGGVMINFEKIEVRTMIYS